MEKTLSLKLKDLGFVKVADELSAKQEQAKKMEKAYASYLYVSEERINHFNAKLKTETLQEDKRASRYKYLKFTDIKDYPKIPPVEVLDALQKAKDDKCFDTFEVAEIDWKEEIKDPVVFGKISGCTDYFFIGQWDDDVKIEDIIFMEK